ncbi:hypothetical protein A2U01_0050435, partial [Trifolium medium]|nr:hypothetical protein [Trifolium medium]
CDRGHGVASPPSLAGAGFRVFRWFLVVRSSFPARVRRRFVGVVIEGVTVVLFGLGSGFLRAWMGSVWVPFAVCGGIGSTGGFGGGFVGCFFISDGFGWICSQGDGGVS